MPPVPPWTTPASGLKISTMSMPTASARWHRMPGRHRVCTRSLRQANSHVPVFAAKSYIGNLGAGGGPAELIASLLAFHHGAIPATLNYEEPDPACQVAVTTDVPEAAGPRPCPQDRIHGDGPVCRDCLP